MRLPFVRYGQDTDCEKMVGEMLMLKLVTVALAGIVTALLARKIMSDAEMMRARVKAKAPQPPQQPVARLRQDPNTGIYYPAD
jgi:hypothetical protein